MPTEKFRRQLRQESEQWWKDGFIDAALYEKLAQRYQFDRLEQDASHRFIAILMGLGAILLGLGAITFVAANWTAWPRSTRVALLLACFVGVNAAGFYLWRRPATERLGHGLLLCGALLLGANMGLMSQMFNQNGELYELLLIWGLGVAAMAFSLRLTSLGVLSLILVGQGYWSGWITGSTWREFGFTDLIVQHLPIVLAVVFVPLAYWCRSRILFGLTATIWAVAIVFNLKPFSGWSSSLPSAGWMAAIAFVLPPALLWSYYDFRKPAPNRPHPSAFTLLARGLAIVFLAVCFYCFSFKFLWDSPTWMQDPTRIWNWTPLIDAVLFSIIAGLGWIQMRPRWSQWRSQIRSINSVTIAIMLLATALMLIAYHSIDLVGAIGFNVLLFGLSIALVRDGLALGDRQTFWGGMVLLVLGITTRMLEYNTGLLLKSIVFILCGIGVIAAGLWFERSTKSTARSLHSAQENLS
ncbi:DUF2157 domain-containing protein [Microcoleus sp. FACHB-1515]|uniref:DUF2157 domain-containing protein n=1 Tax=Cyanophyceae TaxID=3028117 RepID=UPI001687BEA6|nr:DUF2157 domain-containing protein [Microcoleus sp. FACHB-1515]MBD2091107.1 DUF2157 domain-containing protein [Microcoleus sp. FACHB-1515]